MRLCGVSGRFAGRTDCAWLVAALLLQCASAWADGVSLDHAVAQALAHNPDLKTVKAQRDAALARRAAVEGAQWPRVGLHYGARSSDGPLDAFTDRLVTQRLASADLDPAQLNEPERSTLYFTQLLVTLPLYTGGRVSADIAAAVERGKVDQLNYERARELVVFETLRVYREAQAARAGLAIVDDAARAAEGHVRTIAQLVREGRAVVSDRLTAEVSLAGYRSLRAQAATRSTRALDALKRVTGAPLGDHVDVEAELPASAAQSPDDTLALARNALTVRKDLAGARAQFSAARRGVDAARAAHKPRFDLVGASSWYNDRPAPDNRSTSVMGVISLELYAGGSRSAGVDTAAAAMSEQEWRVRSYETRVHDEVRSAADGLRESAARLDIARENVERARAAVRLVNQRYGQGRTILIDLLQSERALAEARQEELNARLGVEIGAAALKLAEGTLAVPEEAMR